MITKARMQNHLDRIYTPENIRTNKKRIAHFYPSMKTKNAINQFPNVIHYLFIN